MSELPPLKVYYDGICPVCRRDRARYERWAGEAGRRVPRLKPLAWLVGLPGLESPLRWCYDRWVRQRLTSEGRLP
ncbi:MAG: hypothetical protein ACQER5_12540 [Pseudomonadota bacterium]